MSSTSTCSQCGDTGFVHVDGLPPCTSCVAYATAMVANLREGHTYERDTLTEATPMTIEAALALVAALDQRGATLHEELCARGLVNRAAEGADAMAKRHAAEREDWRARLDALRCPGPRPREPYEPPAVLSEQVFETLALTCGKSAPSAGCSANPKS